MPHEFKRGERVIWTFEGHESACTIRKRSMEGPGYFVVIPDDGSYADTRRIDIAAVNELRIEG